jgi:hypothetical protein
MIMKTNKYGRFREYIGISIRMRGSSYEYYSWSKLPYAQDLSFFLLDFCYPHYLPSKEKRVLFSPVRKLKSFDVRTFGLVRVLLVEDNEFGSSSSTGDSRASGRDDCSMTDREREIYSTEMQLKTFSRQKLVENKCFHAPEFRLACSARLRIVPTQKMGRMGSRREENKIERKRIEK